MNKFEVNNLKRNLNKKKRSLKTYIVSIFLTMYCILLSGCGISGTVGQNSSKVSDEKDTRPLVVTTIFPYYDFVRQIAGNRVRLKMVVPAGMDSHSFEPTPADMITMQQADLMVCNGGEMEQWVEKVTASLDTENMKILTMMDYVDVLEEETVEGMEDTEHSHEDHDHAHGQSEEDHIHDHDEKKTHEDLSQITFDDHDGHEMDIEYDEHIWTSPVIAKDLLYVTRDAIIQADPANAAIYQKNADAYAAQLDALNESFTDYFAEPEHRTLLFADKFPLQYFANTYGLHCYAAFSGCSSDTEPSIATISNLMHLVESDHLSKVYYFEVSSPAVANVIGEQTGATPTVFQSCHTLTQTDFDNGETYVSLMQRNLKALESQ